MPSNQVPRQSDSAPERMIAAPTRESAQHELCAARVTATR